MRVARRDRLRSSPLITGFICTAQPTHPLRTEAEREGRKHCGMLKGLRSQESLAAGSTMARRRSDHRIAESKLRASKRREQMSPLTQRSFGKRHPRSGNCPVWLVTMTWTPMRTHRRPAVCWVPCTSCTCCMRPRMVAGKNKCRTAASAVDRKLPLRSLGIPRGIFIFGFGEPSRRQPKKLTRAPDIVGLHDTDLWAAKKSHSAAGGDTADEMNPKVLLHAPCCSRIVG